MPVCTTARTAALIRILWRPLSPARRRPTDGFISQQRFLPPPPPARLCMMCIIGYVDAKKEEEGGGISQHQPKISSSVALASSSSSSYIYDPAGEKWGWKIRRRLLCSCCPLLCYSPEAQEGLPVGRGAVVSITQQKHLRHFTRTIG